MSIYLGALPGNLFLASDGKIIKFSVSTAILLQGVLKSLAESETPSDGRQVDNLSLFCESGQIAIATDRIVMFMSPAGARNIVDELPRYITIAALLSGSGRSSAPVRRSPLARQRAKHSVRRPN